MGVGIAIGNEYQYKPEKTEFNQKIIKNKIIKDNDKNSNIYEKIQNIINNNSDENYNNSIKDKDYIKKTYNSLKITPTSKPIRIFKNSF